MAAGLAVIHCRFLVLPLATTEYHLQRRADRLNRAIVVDEHVGSLWRGILAAKHRAVSDKRAHTGSFRCWIGRPKGTATAATVRIQP